LNPGWINTINIAVGNKENIMAGKNIEARVQMIEDVEEIKNMTHQYLFWINERKWDKVLTCFTDDAEVEVRPMPISRGKKEYTKLFLESIAKTNAGKDRDKHYAVMPVITVNGDKAKGEWLVYILISSPEAGNASKWIQGKYENEYAKVDGKWKFSVLRWLRGWPDIP
jgi:hypothetical protein